MMLLNYQGKKQVSERWGYILQNYTASTQNNGLSTFNVVIVSPPLFKNVLCEMAPACSGPAWVAPWLSAKPDKPAELTVASDSANASADRESSFLPKPVKPGKWGMFRLPKWSLILPVNQPAICVPCLPEARPVLLSLICIDPSA